ncbi:hypothetical protein V1506DRAFT_538506 [Lipomyces tetrasporus]
MTFGHPLRESVKDKAGISNSDSRSRSRNGNPSMPHINPSMPHIGHGHFMIASEHDKRPPDVRDERHASEPPHSSKSPSDNYASDDDSDDSDAGRILHAEAESIIGGSAVSLALPQPQNNLSSADGSTEENAAKSTESATEAFHKAVKPASLSAPLLEGNEHRAQSSHDPLDADSFTRGTAAEPTSLAAAAPEPHSHDSSDDDASRFKIFSFSLPFTIPTVPTLKELREFKIGRSSSSLDSSKLAGNNGSADRHVSTINTSSDPSLSHHHRRSLTFKYPKKALTLPIFNSAHNGLTKDQHELTSARAAHPTEQDFKLRSPQDQIDDEAKFSHVHQMDNARLRAVKENLLTSISMEQINLFSSSPKDDFPNIDGDVVIMGGYRGSILRDAKTRRRVWIPIKVGLNIRKIGLEIGLSEDDETNVTKDIIPDGILSHIGPIDISRKLSRRLQANPNCRVHEFGYDWRLSLDNLSKQMVDYLRSLRQKSSAPWKGALVIAHSMGGVIAHGVMQQDPSLFRGLLYVGSPISCVNILGPLRNGENVLLSSKVLAAQVNFTMRSSFVFMPLDGRCFVDKATGEDIRLDFFNVNTWVRYRLSPCVAAPHPISLKSVHEERRKVEGLTTTKSRTINVAEPTSLAPHQAPSPQQSSLPIADAVDYLRRTLERTRKFKESLAFDPSKEYPPLAVVYGDSVPTVRGARVSGEHDIMVGDYSDMIFGPGDGVVHSRNLMPPKGFQICAKVQSERGHVGLLSDVPSIGTALKAILDEESRREEKAADENVLKDIRKADITSGAGNGCQCDGQNTVDVQYGAAVTV